MKTKRKEYNLTPKEYNKSLSFIELMEIRMINCSVKVKKENFPTAEKFNFAVTDKTNINEELSTDENIIIHQQYQLTTYVKTKRDFAFKIIAEYEIKINQTKKLSEDFWEIYKNINLHVNTWPYFREFVQNMTQRINVPPLTLPLLKK